MPHRKLSHLMSRYAPWLAALAARDYARRLALGMSQHARLGAHSRLGTLLGADVLQRIALHAAEPEWPRAILMDDTLDTVLDDLRALLARASEGEEVCASNLRRNGPSGYRFRLRLGRDTTLWEGAIPRNVGLGSGRNRNGFVFYRGPRSEDGRFTAVSLSVEPDDELAVFVCDTCDPQEGGRMDAYAIVYADEDELPRDRFRVEQTLVALESGLSVDVFFQGV